MAFPDDKETFPRRTGKNLAIGELGDVIPAGDYNDPVDFLERLQDTLGTGLLAGYGSLKLRIDSLPTTGTSAVWALLGG